ncbi:MAG: dienelactone hydrolase family protein [Bacteroidetes bacterium]|nr:dienelactone hydrolase family protein [Bacteroidota bacterium]
MLHGRGADEHDLFGLKERLDPRLDIYSLRAPFEYEWGGYAWFDLFEDGTVDEKSFAQSRDEITAFIRTVKTDKLFLLGFSMGAIMSYSIALSHPGICSGILALSGFAPPQLEKEYRLLQLQDLHIFISHGVNDPVIPIASARNTKAMLSASNASVSYHEYPMAHQISEQCLTDIDAWLNERL